MSNTAQHMNATPMCSGRAGASHISRSPLTSERKIIIEKEKYMHHIIIPYCNGRTKYILQILYTYSKL
jgi:hypothetical protein